MVLATDCFVSFARHASPSKPARHRFRSIVSAVLLPRIEPNATPLEAGGRLRVPWVMSFAAKVDFACVYAETPGDGQKTAWRESLNQTRAGKRARPEGA